MSVRNSYFKVVAAFDASLDIMKSIESKLKESETKYEDSLSAKANLINGWNRVKIFTHVSYSWQ